MMMGMKIIMMIKTIVVLKAIISTARCSSSRNSLRGITHSPSPHFGGGATSSFDGIFVLTLLRPGKLRMGDRVLAVNTTDIRIVTHQEAVMALLQHCQVNRTTETVIKVIIINQ